MRASSAALAAILVAACGVPIDQSPRPYDEGVREIVRDAMAPPTTARPSEIGTLAELAFVEGDRLVIVRRRLRAAEAGEVLQALIDGPGAVEGELSVRSAIPPETKGRVRADPSGLAEVDLSTDFAAVGGEEEILAIAQIVVSIDALPDVDGVVFSIDGTRVGVPDGSGALTEEPLTVSEFRHLVLGG